MAGVDDGEGGEGRQEAVPAVVWSNTHSAPFCTNKTFGNVSVFFWIFIF